MALHVTWGAGKQVPVAAHPADSGKPQIAPVRQSASVVQVPDSSPASPAPEVLLDPELPLDPELLLDPELALDAELPPDDPDPPLDPEPALEPELPLDDPEPPFDPELLLDPDPPLDPELLLRLLSAAASPKLNESPLPEQPMAHSAVHAATSGMTARASIDFMGPR